MDFQNEAALLASATSKGKRKAPVSDVEDADEEDIVMDFNIEQDDGDSDDNKMDSESDDVDVDGTNIVPMPQSGSITALREKLHARMAALRRGGIQDGEAGDRDELLEERRRQRAAMREKRRKETKEKIRKEEEAKGKKGKGKEKEKDSRPQGHLTKVKIYVHGTMMVLLTVMIVDPTTCTRPAIDIQTSSRSRTY